MQNLKIFLVKNKYFIILYIIATLYFIYQHHVAVFWDFDAYVLNAKYWFASGFYFEPFRPPLVPFLISFFSVFGWGISEYLFIIFSSFLFLLSTRYLAKVLRFNELLFYIISLNVFLLNIAFMTGTELISFSMIEFFIASLIKKRSNGHFLSLAVLARYTNIIYTPFLLFNKRVKNILFNILLFFLVFLPWLIYNYIIYKNPLASLLDSFLGNVYYRADYLAQPPLFLDFVKSLNYLMPFIVIGIAVSVFSLKNRYQLKKNIIFYLLILVAVYSYVEIPFKTHRYLFNLLLPAFYFSYLGIDYLAKDRKNVLRVFMIAILVLNVTTLYILEKKPEIYTGEDTILYEKNEFYLDAINEIKKLNLSNCSIVSNSYVILTYLGQPAKPMPSPYLLEREISNGEVLIIFNIEEPEKPYKPEILSKLPLLKETKNFNIYSNKKCLPIRKFNKTWVEIIEYNKNQTG